MACLLSGTWSRRPPGSGSRTKSRRLSAAARKRIAAAQKKRWAESRKTQAAKERQGPRWGSRSNIDLGAGGSAEHESRWG